MSKIQYRIAKPSDAKAIANLHWHVRDRYVSGIALALGERYLRAYYKIVLNDPWEVVVCAVDESGEIVGFNSSSLNAKERFNNIKGHKLYLALAAFKSLLFHPSLFKELWQRYRSLGDNNNGKQFVHTEGIRGCYWCWKKEYPSLGSFRMREIKDNVLRDLGVKEYFFEVDKSNDFVYNFQIKVSKAIPIEEITLPDGRVRVLMKKVLRND